MAIDPSIPLQVRPMQMPDPLANYGRMVQLKSLMQQGDLQSMQMDQMVRDRAAQEAENAAYRDALDPATGRIDTARLYSSLSQAGRGSRIPAVMQQQAALEKDRLAADKTRGEISKQEFDMAAARNRALIQRLTPLMADPNLSHESVIGAISEMVQQGVATPEMGQQAVRALPGNPQALRDFLRSKLISAMDADKQLAALTPNLDRVDDGQKIRYVDKNPMTNPGGPAPIQRQMTPGEVQSAKDAAAGRAVTMRGQNMADQRAAVQAGQPVYDAERGAWVFRPSAQAPAGAAVPVMGPDGRPLPPKMSEAQKKELNSIDAQIRIIDSGIKAASDTPTAFTFGRGLATMGGAIPESLAGRGDTKAEREARAYVFNTVSKTINERAGAAQSAQELARLRAFLPAETDGPEQVRDKLQAFRQYLVDQRQAFAQPNYAAPPEPPAASTPAPQRPASTPRPGTVEDGWIFNGGDPADRNNWKRAR